MPAVKCPDCGAVIGLPAGARAGDHVECPNCAGQALRLHGGHGRWEAVLAHRVSCPDCDAVITLPADVRAGDTVGCCGRTYTLTFEYGTFAAERQ
jgi:uncharacterized paraquat-inducible protein A